MQKSSVYSQSRPLQTDKRKWDLSSGHSGAFTMQSSPKTKTTVVLSLS